MKKNCGCSCPPRPEPPHDPCVICPKYASVYAYYSQNGRLYNSALFGGIRFENEPVETEGFYYDTGVVQIVQPGTYLITYFVNFPASAAVNTVLAIQANNQNVSGLVRSVQKSVTGVPFTAAAQAIVTFQALTALRLSSSSVLDITLMPEETAASLSIIKL